MQPRLALGDRCHGLELEDRHPIVAMHDAVEALAARVDDERIEPRSSAFADQRRPDRLDPGRIDDGGDWLAQEVLDPDPEVVPDIHAGLHDHVGTGSLSAKQHTVGLDGSGDMNRLAVARGQVSAAARGSVSRDTPRCAAQRPTEPKVS